MIIELFIGGFSWIFLGFMYEAFWVYFDFAIVKKWKGLKLGAGAIQEGVAILIKRTWKREPRKNNFPSFEAFSRFSC